MKKFYLLFILINLFMIMSGFTQTITISGTVISAEDKNPLPGASVSVKGTTQGTVTDAKGNYTITVSKENSVLVFSFIGLLTEEVAYQGNPSINISLVSDIKNLNEVVVVGYGIQKKRDVSGTIATIKGEELRSLPVQSFDQALQGKAAGVNITVPNGVLNNPPVIRVRGFNSISSSSYPLIVVDGVAVFTGDNSRNSSAANALGDINPADIASIDILKDASATAIYGSRAANGVILITTKKGDGAKTKVSIDSYVGYTQPYHLFQVLNTEQYLEVKNTARSNANLTTFFKSATDVNGNTIDTKWADFIYRTGVQQNHSVTVSGSNPSTSYFLSLGYSNQDGIVKKNDFSRKNVRLNLDHKLTKFITLGANASYINTYNSAPNTGSLPGQGFNTGGAGRLAFVTGPIVGPYNNDGTYNIDKSGNRLGRGDNPDYVGFYNPVLLFDLDKYSSENDHILGSVFATIEPIKGLYLKTIYGIDNLVTESITYQNPIHGDGAGTGGLSSNYLDRRNRWTWTNTINYLKTIGEKFNINAITGIEEQYSSLNGWSGSQNQVADPYVNSYEGSWVTPVSPPSLVQTENYFVSYFGRLDLNYDRKYYLGFSLRDDGFSGLAKGNKYGTFGGASVMWNISREPFSHDLTESIGLSDLRLKASYGRVGNISGLADFGSLYLYKAGVYGSTPTLYFSQAGNPDLKWEASNKFDVGILFSVVKDRFQVELNYYKNTINNLILDVPQAPSKGIPGNTVPQNVGSMYNKGFEISFTSHNINTKNFQWTTNLNVSTLKNEVTALAPGVDNIPGRTGSLETTNRTLVGYPIGQIYGVITHGVDPQTGRRIFVDKNGREVLYSHVVPSGSSKWTYRDDGTTASPINVAADGKPLGSPIPKIYGGIDNSLSFYNFDFNLSLTYALDFYVYNGSKAGLRDQRSWNNSIEVYNTYWKQPGDITDIPRPVYGDNVSNGSSFLISENVEKGNFLKVRSLSSGYTFRNIAGSKYFDSIRLYAQVFNAFVFTKYKGSDPEVSTNGNSNLAPGVDRNTVPQARTVNFGININF